MMVLKLEMWPGGDERKMYELGRTYIDNIGGTAKRGDYRARVMRKGHLEYSQPAMDKRIREGRVHDYPRVSYNVWRLVIRALLDCFPEEKK